MAGIVTDLRGIVGDKIVVGQLGSNPRAIFADTGTPTPSSPSTGDVAITNTAVWRYNGTSWEQLAVAGGSSFSPSAIINGNFDVWQRNTTFNQLADGEYSVDRFRVEITGAGLLDCDRSTTVPDDGSEFSALFTVDTADASLAATDLYAITQVIEGYNAQRFALGSSGATQLTLDFWVRSSVTGTYCVAFKNTRGAAARTYVVEYSISAANTWEQKTITISGDTTGTWLRDHQEGLHVAWCLGGGSNFQVSAGAWAAGDDYCTSNQTNLMATAANTFYLSRVGLYVGASAPDFPRRTFAAELGDCLRYFLKTFPYDIAVGQNQGTDGTLGTHADGTSTIGIWLTWQFPQVMRIAPSVVTYNPSANDGKWLATGGVDVAATVVRFSHYNVTLRSNAAPQNHILYNIHASADAEF